MPQNEGVVPSGRSLLSVITVEADDMIFWWERKQHSLCWVLSHRSHMETLGKADCLPHFTHSSPFPSPCVCVCERQRVKSPAVRYQVSVSKEKVKRETRWYCVAKQLPCWPLGTEGPGEAYVGPELLLK